VLDFYINLVNSNIAYTSIDIWHEPGDGHIVLTVNSKIYIDVSLTICGLIAEIISTNNHLTLAALLHSADYLFVSTDSKKKYYSKISLEDLIRKCTEFKEATLKFVDNKTHQTFEISKATGPIKDYTLPTYTIKTYRELIDGNFYKQVFTSNEKDTKSNVDMLLSLRISTSLGTKFEHHCNNPNLKIVAKWITESYCAWMYYCKY